MITSEEAIKKLEMIYNNLDSGKYKYTGDGIRETFKELCPLLKTELDELFFSFSSPVIIRGKAKIASRFQAGLPFRIYIGNISPLKVSACFSALSCPNINGVEKIENFVNFLKAFDERTENVPPGKRQLQILFDWFANNVEDRLWKTPMSYGNFWDWRQIITGKKTFKKSYFKKAYIPEGFTLKDLTAHILATDRFPDLPRKTVVFNKAEPGRE